MCYLSQQEGKEEQEQQHEEEQESIAGSDTADMATTVPAAADVQAASKPRPRFCPPSAVAGSSVVTPMVAKPPRTGSGGFAVPVSAAAATAVRATATAQSGPKIGKVLGMKRTVADKPKSAGFSNKSGIVGGAAANKHRKAAAGVNNEEEKPKKAARDPNLPKGPKGR